MEASRTATSDGARRVDSGIGLEVQMLANIRAEIDRHAKECSHEPKAILLNPANHELLGWNEVLGLPVLPSKRAQPMHARLVCGTGIAGRCEEGDVFWDGDGRPYAFIPDRA